MIRIVAGCAAVGVLLAAAAIGSPPAAGAAVDEAERLFQYADERIVESSGLAASAVYRGIVYTHNDSDDAGRVFAVDTEGQTRAVITLGGVEARDWEGIATGVDGDGRRAIFVGDIGDNLLGAWPEIWVYRFPEPATLSDTTVEPVRFRFRYEDGPRDAEALLVDPRDNRIYVVSKENGGGGVYRAPVELSTDSLNVLERISDAPALVTDGAFTPSGERFALRDYLTARIYDRPGNEIELVVLPIAAQGEAVTYTRDGQALLTGSEGRHSSVWRVPVPDSAVSESDDDTVPPPGDNAKGDTAGDAVEPSVFWGNLVALVASAAALVGLYQTISRRRQKAKKAS